MMFLKKANHTKIQLHLDIQKMAIVIPVLVLNPENNKQNININFKKF